MAVSHAEAPASWRTRETGAVLASDTMRTTSDTTPGSQTDRRSRLRRESRLELVVADAPDMGAHPSLRLAGILRRDRLDDDDVLVHRGLDAPRDPLGELADPCEMGAQVVDQGPDALVPH